MIISSKIVQFMHNDGPSSFGFPSCQRCSHDGVSAAPTKTGRLRHLVASKVQAFILQVLESGRLIKAPES